MSEKPIQAQSNKKRTTRNKAAISIPISLHFYAVEIVVIIVVVFIINIYSQSIFKSFIADDCNKRLEDAVNSTQAFIQSFSMKVDASDDRTDDNIRAYLHDSISASDNLSSRANIVLYTLDDGTGDYSVIWPTILNSASYAKSAKNIVGHVIAAHGYESLNTTQIVDIDGTIYYYRTVGFKFVKPEDKNIPGYLTPTESPLSSDDADIESSIDESLSKYYLCVYVNSSSYYSLMAANSLSLVQAALLSIVIAGILSIIMTYPLIYSTQKLSRFAKNISKGNFKRIKGLIVSKELSELSDVMNQMAYKLEESDIEQKTFFQNASHELRTPLMSIQGYAEGLKYGVFDSDEDRNNAIDVIIDETGRLSGLVENLLSISKMDMSKSGGYEVKKQNIDARKIYDTVIDRVRGNFIHEDKAIIIDMKIKKTYIYANENDMFRCLENIFSNCLRYCKSAVTFRCIKDETGNNVIYEISDDGPGISPEVSAHLFERFSKGSDGKHGIGLALAKAIAEEHGGTVKAYNKTEGGACFEVIIPVIKQRDQLSKINNDSTT